MNFIILSIMYAAVCCFAYGLIKTVKYNDEGMATDILLAIFWPLTFFIFVLFMIGRISIEAGVFIGECFEKWVGDK